MVEVNPKELAARISSIENLDERARALDEVLAGVRQESGKLVSAKKFYRIMERALGSMKDIYKGVYLVPLKDYLNLFGRYRDNPSLAPGLPADYVQNLSGQVIGAISGLDILISPGLDAVKRQLPGLVKARKQATRQLRQLTRLGRRLSKERIMTEIARDPRGFPLNYALGDVVTN